MGTEPTHSALDTYCYDLNELVGGRRATPVQWRDTAVQRMVEVLSRRAKRNPLLVGSPTTDVLSVVEELAHRISDNKVPEPLGGVRVLAVDSGKLVAGTRYRGDFEQRVGDLLREVRGADVPIVLYFDELWLGATEGGEGGITVADMLKFPLATGEAQCIVSCTLEHLNWLRSRGMLSRQLQAIMVSVETSR